MRHHTTSIVGPDIDESNHPATPDSCPSPYPSDLLAAIPWAKEAGLELKQEEDGTWLFRCGGEFYCQCAGEWTNKHAPSRGCGHQEREDALRFPPPKPPGFVEAKPEVVKGNPPGYVAPKAKAVDTCSVFRRAWDEMATEPAPAQPSVGEKLAQVCYEAFHNGNPPEGYPHFTPWFLSAALAVRREVLAEPFTDEDVKAADKAFMAFRGGGRTDWIRAALSAAIASRLARARTEGGGG